MKILPTYVLICLFMFLLVGCESKNTSLIDDIKGEKKGDTHFYENLSNDFIKTYHNNGENYSLEYPAYFTIEEVKPTAVFFSNKTCETNDRLCFKGIDGFQVIVEKNLELKNLDEYFSSLKKDGGCSRIERFKIFPIPENFNETEMIETVKCSYDEVPKQEKGGYRYTFFKDGKNFTISFIQSDTFVPGYSGSIIEINKQVYDSLGDEIMRTFKFLK